MFNSKGKATIVEDIDNSVWGVVWCMSSRDVHFLDKKEKQNLSNFKNINKNVIFKNGQQDEAFIYIADDGGNPVPDQSTINFVIYQARYWVLSCEHISFLKYLITLHSQLRT